MTITIKKGTARGEVVAPPSKSYAHRELICAALSGSGTVSNIAFSEDIEATLSCLKSLGFLYEIKGDVIRFLGRDNIEGAPSLRCKASGSTMRFMIPVALALTDEFEIVGEPRLIERGIGVYEDICRKLGIEVLINERSIRFKGKLLPGDFVVPGNVSSQFITGLLLALPLLNGDSNIEVLPPFESQDYVKISLDVISKYGVEIKQAWPRFEIEGTQEYRPISIDVEGDYSNASFLDAWNYLGGNVAVKGLNSDSLQGDKVYGSLFSLLSKGYAEIDISDCIDLGPVLIGFASLFFGARLTGARRLRIKESDRGLAMKEELEKIGGKVDVFEDEIVVAPLKINKAEAVFDSHNDHRIAMALSLLAGKMDVSICGAEAVKKSYPDYFDVLSRLGLEVTHE